MPTTRTEPETLRTNDVLAGSTCPDPRLVSGGGNLPFTLLSGSGVAVSGLVARRGG